MDVAANTNFSEIILSIWTIDPKKLEVILQRKENLEIGNIVLNSAEHPYFDKVLEQAINFPDKMFEIPVYCTDTSYDSIVERTLNYTNEILKSNGVTNLRLTQFLFEDKTKNNMLPRKIDEIKWRVIHKYLTKGIGVQLFDQDYIYMHNNQKLNDTFRKYGVCFFIRKNREELYILSPAILCFSPDTSELLCVKIEDVNRYHNARHCTTHQLRSFGLKLDLSTPFILSLHDLHQDEKVFTGTTWDVDIATKSDKYGNPIEGIEDKNTQKIIDELLHPHHSLQESIDKYKPRVTIDMTDKPEKLKEEVVEIGRS